MPEICHIAEEHKFLVFGVTESSVYESEDLNNIKLAAYKAYFSNTLHNPNIRSSRVTVFVHQDLTVKVRSDLMNEKLRRGIFQGH